MLAKWNVSGDCAPFWPHKREDAFTCSNLKPSLVAAAMAASMVLCGDPEPPTKEGCLSCIPADCVHRLCLWLVISGRQGPPLPCLKEWDKTCLYLNSSRQPLVQHIGYGFLVGARGCPGGGGRGGGGGGAPPTWWQSNGRVVRLEAHDKVVQLLVAHRWRLPQTSFV